MFNDNGTLILNKYVSITQTQYNVWSIKSLDLSVKKL